MKIVLSHVYFRDGCLNDLGRSDSDAIEEQWIVKNQKNLEFKVFSQTLMPRVILHKHDYQSPFRLSHSMKVAMFSSSVNSICVLVVTVICQLSTRF